MAITETISVTKKQAYKRPYKTRQQRRKADSMKSDESADSKYLMKVAVVIGFLLLLAIGFAIKGLAERESATAPFPTAAGQ